MQWNAAKNVVNPETLNENMLEPLCEMFIDNSDYNVIASVTKLFLYYSICQYDIFSCYTSHFTH